MYMQPDFSKRRNILRIVGMDGICWLGYEITIRTITVDTVTFQVTIWLITFQNINLNLHCQQLNYELLSSYRLQNWRESKISGQCEIKIDVLYYLAVPTAILSLVDHFNGVL